jgi:signal recognition particle subunit SRP14
MPGENTDRHIVVHGEDIDAAVPEATTDEPFPDLNPSKPIPILIRATNGKHKDKKIKLSTIVEPDALEAFFVKYAEVCKLGMSGLKKRDRSKAKERLKAKKRKQGGAAVAGDVKKA